MHIHPKKTPPWYLRIWGPNARGEPSLLGDIEDVLWDLLTFPLRLTAHLIANLTLTLFFHVLTTVANINLWLRGR